MTIIPRRLALQAAAVAGAITAVTFGVTGTAHADTDFPIKLQLNGWTCQQPADEKTVCTDGTSSVSVNWRPAEQHDKWAGLHGRKLTILGEPGWLVRDGGPVAVGSVQEGGFVTVQTYDQATRKAVASVAEALVWA